MFLWLGRWFIGQIGHQMASFQVDLQLWILVANVHVIKCEKMSWPLKLLDLMVYFFPLTFFNELTIKCVGGFGGFVKMSKDPW